MMLLAMHLGRTGDNLLAVLTGFLPLMGKFLTAFPAITGSIINQGPHTNWFAIARLWFERHVSLTIKKTALDADLKFLISTQLRKLFVFGVVFSIAARGYCFRKHNNVRA